MRTNTALALLAASASASAWELPFSKLWSGTGDDAQVPLSAPGSTSSNAHVPPRVAIIGAGAAGSSAAFFIAKANDRFGLDVEVDVYEQNDYVGGRVYFLACTIYDFCTECM